jgi:hypothetical protein
MNHIIAAMLSGQANAHRANNGLVADMPIIAYAA